MNATEPATQESSTSTPLQDGPRRRRRPRRRTVAAIAATTALSFGVATGVTAVAADNAGTTAPVGAGTAPALPAIIPAPYDRRGWAAPSSPWPSDATPAETSDPLDTTTATATQETGMALVSTSVEFGAGQAAGTGMVLTSDGLVVTNHHVVEGATAVEVTLATTGTTYDAEVLGTDVIHDVALLQLDGATGLTTVDTDTTAVTAGQDVTAIGDAGGDGGSLTAASGTVVATGQFITVDDGSTGTSLTGLVEINADVVAGDSGGAVLDTDGEVVAMTTAASSGTADITGYAVPIATVLSIVDTITAGIATGTVTIGYDAFLGVLVDPLTPDSATVAGVVDGSAASGLGLTAGDTITAIDGEPVDTAEELQQAITDHESGERIQLTWTDTAGYSHAGTVTLGQAPVG